MGNKMVSREEFVDLTWKAFLKIFDFGDESVAKKYFESADAQDTIDFEYKSYCAKVRDHIDSDAPYWAETCAYNLEMLY